MTPPDYERAAAEHATRLCGEGLQDSPVLNQHVPAFIRDAFLAGARAADAAAYRRGVEAAAATCMDCGGTGVWKDPECPCCTHACANCERIRALLGKEGGA